MKYVLGFDIGGTKCAISLGKVDKTIEILFREEVPTLDSATLTLNKFENSVKKLLKEYDVSSIGISCGGPLDSKTGEIFTTNLPNWYGFNIVKYVEEKYKIKAFLQNDANACALAEWKMGAGKGTKNMIFLTFGTGLGAGLILNGKLYSGTNDNAGECGHIRMRNSGPIGFNKVGSLEGFSSGAGITKLAKIMLKKEKTLPDSIAKMGGIDKITTKSLALYAHQGDKFCLKVFKKSGEILGEGLSILIDILNPEKIVIGGVFMRSGDLLIPSMEKVIKKEALSFSRNVCKIEPALLSENIGDYAAICVGLNL